MKHNILFYCIASSDEDNTKIYNLQQSLLKFDYDINILRIYDNNLKNLSKIIKLNEYLQQNSFNDDDIIVFLDAYDVLCCKDPNELKNYLIKNDCDILISTEDMFGRHLDLVRPYYDVYNKNTNKYINSGVYFGYANKLKLLINNLFNSFESLKEIVDRSCNHDSLFSDQCYLSLFLYKTDFINNSTEYKIKLDIDDDIIFTNTTTNRKYNISDYVFIHTWGLYGKWNKWNIHHRVKQKEKYDLILNHLNIDGNSLLILVPERDRKNHEEIFKPYITNFLKKKNINFCIIFIHQSNNLLFNRGLLFNIGFKYALSKYVNFNYICCHDVDLLPLFEDEYNCDYSFSPNVRHISKFVNNKQNEYDSYLGGVTIFSKQIFEKINGFSNSYNGWGYEDDDIRRRINRYNIPIERCNGHFFALHHKENGPSSNINYINNQRLFFSHPNGTNDGLNTITEYKDEKLLKYDIVDEKMEICNNSFIKHIYVDFL
jgi:hypothetical protein